MPVNLIGKRIGIFQIESRISEGGGGIVYKARIEDVERENRRGRTAAVKVIRMTKDDYETEKWLMNEVNFLRDLSHPSIVRLYPVSLARLAPERNQFLRRVEASVDPELPWYMAMEYLEGGTVAQLLNERLSNYSPAWKMELLYQMASVLNYVHCRDKTHRDIKPENIVMRFRPSPHERPQPVLIDFGLTEKGAARGAMAISPRYTAPEKFAAINAMRRDPELRQSGYPLEHDLCDVWSLGVIAYELFNGRYPYRSISLTSGYTQVSSVILDKPPDEMNRDVPPDIKELIAHMLNSRPKDRFYTADVLSYLETRLERYAPPFI